MTGNIIVALVHSHFQPVFRPQAVEGRGIHHRANHSFRAKGKKVICARHSPGVGHAQDLARIPKWKLGRVLSSGGLRHLQLKFLSAKEKIRDGYTALDHIGTDFNIADPLNKGLPNHWLSKKLRRLSSKLAIKRLLLSHNEYLTKWENNWSSIHYRIARLKTDQEFNTTLDLQPLCQCSIWIARLKGFLLPLRADTHKSHQVIYPIWNLRLKAIGYLREELSPKCSIKTSMAEQALGFGRVLKDFGSKSNGVYRVAGGIAAQAISSIQTVYSYVGERQTLHRFNSALQKSMELGVKQGLIKGMLIGSMSIMNALPNLSFILEATSVIARMLQTTERDPAIDTQKRGKVLGHGKGKVEFK
ncbi:hypothetical protein Prudu_002168 [Prunus dulcis]|uniref:ABC transmembrane type-1 domain-containing protein n=1 Tax=Prunus dulcis TaxID=3755 RepID=A0A4Y1QQ82_PRUDU|nr:hypothetical protein Prudu_002168 [Prunus dulcis]